MIQVNHLIAAALSLCTALAAFGQPDDGQDLLSLLGTEETTDYTTATFKSTRVINMHSNEQAAGGVLDFRISHRFGYLNTGPSEFFGLDGATIRLGLEYGISDRIMVGFGRSSFNKTLDGFAKVKILRQSTGKRKMPVSLSAFTSMIVETAKWRYPERTNYFSSRLKYTYQLIVTRKFSEKLSLQLTPTVVHRNLVATLDEAHDVYALGAGGRYKLTRRTSVNAEYFYVPEGQLAPNYRNSLSLGFDIETGGHVFQLHFTNSTSMVEPGFITETVGDWTNGDIHFGFNVSRVFTIREKKKPAEY